jgi:hypothetical protein
VQLDVTDEETRALVNLLVETIEADRYPLSPRVQLLRQILARFRTDGTGPPTSEERVIPAGSRICYVGREAAICDLVSGWLARTLETDR